MVSVGVVASIAITTTVAVAVGDLVIVRHSCQSAARPATAYTCADNATSSTNTYAIAIDGGNAVDCYASIWWVVATTTMPIGTVITVTTTPSKQFQGIDAIKCANPSSSTPLDAGPTKFASGNSAFPATSPAVSPATSDWVGVVAIYQNDTSVTPQASWTEDMDDATVGAERQTIIGTNTTAMNGAGTLFASSTWAICCAVFSLGAAAPAARTVGSWMTRSGVTA